MLPSPFHAHLRHDAASTNCATRADGHTWQDDDAATLCQAQQGTVCSAADQIEVHVDTACLIVTCSSTQLETLNYETHYPAIIADPDGVCKLRPRGAISLNWVQGMPCCVQLHVRSQEAAVACVFANEQVIAMSNFPPFKLQEPVSESHLCEWCCSRGRLPQS